MAANMMSQLKNPWVMAALAAVGSYVAINRMKPGFVYNQDKSLKNEMLNPLTISAGISAVILLVTQMKGKRMGRGNIQLGSGAGSGLSGGLLAPESFNI